MKNATIIYIGRCFLEERTATIPRNAAAITDFKRCQSINFNFIRSCWDCYISVANSTVAKAGWITAIILQDGVNRRRWKSSINGICIGDTIAGTKRIRIRYFNNFKIASTTAIVVMVIDSPYCAPSTCGIINCVIIVSPMTASENSIWTSIITTAT